MNAGITRVFDYNGTAWEQLGDGIPGLVSGVKSAYRISLAGDGSRVVVGEQWADPDGAVDAGRVRAFEWNCSSASWQAFGESLDGAAAGDRFGREVSLSRDGTSLAVTARNHGDDAGQVTVYRAAHSPSSKGRSCAAVSASLFADGVVPGDWDPCEVGLVLSENSDSSCNVKCNTTRYLAKVMTYLHIHSQKCIYKNIHAHKHL